MSGKDLIIAAINSSKNDETLIQMKPIQVEDWKSWIRHYQFSSESTSLMKLLERYHPKISKACLQIGADGGVVNPITLAKWLVIAANRFGAEKAYESLLALETTSTVPIFVVTLISGMNFSGSIDFGLGVKLVGENQLPSEIQHNVCDKVAGCYRDIAGPATFLYMRFDSDIADTNKHESTFSKISDYLELESSVVNFLSLFAISHAPSINRRWCLLPDTVPLSGIYDTNTQSYIEVRHPKMYENWDGIDINEVIRLYTKYKDIPLQKRQPIDISIWRRSQAMNSWNSINKAIDLGIALESVLTTSSTDQLALQVRVLGAKLAENDFAQRQVIFSKLKVIYKIRSNAVHNGKIEQSYKIPNQGSVSVNQILAEGVTIMATCLKKIIERKGMSPDDLELLLLE